MECKGFKIMIHDFISKLTKLPYSSWSKNADIILLVNDAENFQKDRIGYINEMLKNAKENHIEPEEIGSLKIKLEECLKIAKKNQSDEDDLYIAQAIEIVTHDFGLLHRMQQANVDELIISEMKLNIVQDAIDVGRRLLRNAVRRIHALEFNNEELDTSKIMTIKENYNLSLKDIDPIMSIYENSKRVHLIINAGRSTRLKTTIPKGIIYLNTKPIIQNTIEAGKGAGFTETIVVLGFKEALNKKFLPDTVLTVNQPSVEGTAHAVMSAFNILKNFKGTLLVSYSDMPFITANTLRNLCYKHEKLNSIMTILTTSSDNRPEFGKLVKDKNGHYIRIAQPRIETNLSNQVDAGFYCFSCPEFWNYLGDIKNRNNRYEFYLTDIMSVLSKNGKIIGGYETENQIETIGINRREDLEQAYNV